MKSTAPRQPNAPARVPRRRKAPLPLILLADVLLACIGLIVFALFHHVLPRDIMPSGQALPRPSTAITSTATTAGTSDISGMSGATASEAGSETTEVATTARGLWGGRFADKFTDGEIIQSDNSYQSSNINITISRIQENDVAYYVADIYLRDIDYLRTAFAGGVYAHGRTSSVLELANENNAVLAMTGDYYGIHDRGVVIRNGELYREGTFEDVLVLNYDGSMATYTAEAFDIEAVKAGGAWQAWSFGPMLLDDGQPMSEFNSDVPSLNPRSAIGCFEPGHYCFVLVDGRQEGYSVGMTLAQLSQLFYDLGCVTAYNLDGGQSAVLTFMGQVVNQPYRDGRPVSDIVYIGE